MNHQSTTTTAAASVQFIPFQLQLTAASLGITVVLSKPLVVIVAIMLATDKANEQYKTSPKYFVESQ